MAENRAGAREHGRLNPREVSSGPPFRNVPPLTPPGDAVQVLGPDAKEREYAYAHRDQVLTHVDRSRAVIDTHFHYVRNCMPDQPAIWTPSLYKQLDIGYDELPIEMLHLRAEGRVAPRTRAAIHLNPVSVKHGTVQTSTDAFANAVAALGLYWAVLNEIP